MLVQEIIRSHPDVRGSDNDALLRCIEQCFDCAEACTSCADACLAEQNVADLVQCIRANLDCADLCGTTAIIATRRAGSNEEVIRQMLRSCSVACSICAEECMAHAGHMEHCRICAEACKRCEEACEEALVSMGGRMDKSDGRARH